MTAMSAHLAIPLGQLRAQFTGRVIAPGDAAYDAARSVFIGGVDRRPAVIIRPADASEVARVVTLARETGLHLAVRSGGHSLAGHSVCDGGIVLDLSAMRRLDIDVERRTAWAQTGLTAGEYTTAASVHGLATGFGDTASVGIGGLTLGGGIGFLVGKHGLTIDSLLAAEIVTSDGQILHVDADHHPDLFWAIRGGWELRCCHPVPVPAARGRHGRGRDADPAGHPGGHHLVRRRGGGRTGCPDNHADVMPAPPLPFLPAEHHGRAVVMAWLCYAGRVDAGERAVAPLRALATPIVDMVEPMPYRDIYLPEEEDHPLMALHTMFLDTIDHDAAELILDRLPASTAAMPSVHLRVLGGAMAGVPADATAFAHRNRRIMAIVAAFYERAEAAAEHQAWIAELAAALPDSDEGAYVNFLGDAGEPRVHDAYPGSTWDRLVSIKTRYDPTNLFHVNHNIPPASQDP